MNRISIGFSKPKKWKSLSSLIMLVEGTSYSHVFVTWHCKDLNRRKVFEAVGSGIRILSNVTFKKNAEVVKLYDFYVDDHALLRIEQTSHDLTGRPYGTLSLVGLLIMRAFNFFNRVFDFRGRQHNPFKDGKFSQVCVEASGVVLDEVYPNNIEYEDFGLKEINVLVRMLSSESADKDRLDKINGKVNKKK